MPKIIIIPFVFRAGFSRYTKNALCVPILALVGIQKMLCVYQRRLNWHSFSVMEMNQYQWQHFNYA